MWDIISQLFGQQPEDELMSNDYRVPRVQDLMKSTDPYSMGSMGANMGTQPSQPSGPMIDQFNPSRIAFDRLNQLYDQIPQKTPPSLGRRVMSGLSGLAATGPATYYNGMALGFKSDPEMQNKIMELHNYKPYYDQMDEFGSKERLGTKTAELEDRMNTNERQSYDQRERLRISDEELKRKVASDATKDTNTDLDRDRKAQEAADKLELAVKAEARKARWTDAYITKTQKPNLKTLVDDKGFVHFYDPATGVTTATELNTGEMNDRELELLKIEGRLSEIAAQNTARLGQIAAAGSEQRTTNSEKPPTVGAADRTPSVDQQIKLIKTNHPEWAKWISDKGVVTKPNTLLPGGIPQVVYDQIVAEMKKVSMPGVRVGNAPTNKKPDPAGIRP